MTTVIHCILDNILPQLIDEGGALDRYLFSRQVPQEQKEVYLAKKNIEKDILRRDGVQHASELGTFIGFIPFYVEIFAFCLNDLMRFEINQVIIHV